MYILYEIYTYIFVINAVLLFFSGGSKANAQTVKASNSSLNRWKKEPRTLFNEQSFMVCSQIVREEANIFSVP